MKNAYLGIDIGSISTKGVIIDEKNKIVKIGDFALSVLIEDNKNIKNENT